MHSFPLPDWICLTNCVSTPPNLLWLETDGRLAIKVLIKSAKRHITFASRQCCYGARDEFKVDKSQISLICKKGKRSNLYASSLNCIWNIPTTEAPWMFKVAWHISRSLTICKEILISTHTSKCISSISISAL